ncbi:MAG: protein phosphatase 2C domain-containing protein [Vicinamibacterales bacterium]
MSDVGRVRKTNEDAFVADLDVNLFCVADGMGGHDAGEVASALAIEAISAFIRRSSADTDFSWPYGIDRSLSYDANRLRTAVYLANRRIFRTAENNDDYNGMGTTIVGALVNGTRMAVAHVGDSRLYLIRKGRIRQLTADDSWAATILAHDPRMNPADIAKHPMRNVLTNVLGAREQVDVHVAEHDLEVDDVVLLCSDGLHGSVDETTLAQIATNQKDLKIATRTMVDTALDKGSRDNVTALLLRLGGREA